MALMFSMFLVMVGGALGAGGRYLAGRWVSAIAGGGYPWGTLSVNLVGGLLMGVLVGATAKMATNDPVRLFLAVGVLGGFTTFSAFSLDVVTMIERGSWAAAIGYALASVTGSVVALVMGMMMARGLA